MGGAKRLLEEIWARGWASVEKTVCSGCLLDPALVEAVRNAGGVELCDYCGDIPVSPEASSSVDLILELIVDGFNYEYEDPVQQVLWSSADGGYQMPMDSTWDLLDMHEVTENGDLFQDLERAIDQQEWVQRDPYAASPANALTWGWQAFREFVKHRRRYTFLVFDPSERPDGGEIEMDRFPSALADAVVTAGQVRVLAKGTKWWRVRVHAAGEEHSSARALGSPPDASAKDNRMTAKGMGAFYGASTPVGAQAEVAGYAEPEDEGTVGQFELLNDIFVVDLRSVEDIPSLFDEAQRHKRAPRSFLLDFTKDVAKIADPSDRQNLDYIPTQIVAEYFRYEVRGTTDRVRGVLWRSSIDNSVDNCVIFASNAEMADLGDTDASSVLSLDPATVRVISAPLAT